MRQKSCVAAMRTSSARFSELQREERVAGRSRRASPAAPAPAGGCSAALVPSATTESDRRRAATRALPGARAAPSARKPRVESGSTKHSECSASEPRDLERGDGGLAQRGGPSVALACVRPPDMRPHARSCRRSLDIRSRMSSLLSHIRIGMSSSHGRAPDAAPRRQTRDPRGPDPGRHRRARREGPRRAEPRRDLRARRLHARRLLRALRGPRRLHRRGDGARARRLPRRDHRHRQSRARPRADRRRASPTTSRASRAGRRARCSVCPFPAPVAPSNSTA